MSEVNNIKDIEVVTSTQIGNCIYARTNRGTVIVTRVSGGSSALVLGSSTSITVDLFDGENIANADKLMEFSCIRSIARKLCTANGELFVYAPIQTNRKNNPKTQKRKIK